MDVREELAANGRARLRAVLLALGIAAATWYYRPVRSPIDGRRERRLVLPVAIEGAVVTMAETNPWHGHKRIAVMCRRDGTAVTDRQAYATMSAYGLLHKRRRVRAAGLYQASKLYELLPTAANDLWQMDLTYVHIPGHGWWYAVTVIDYYSRFLLALRLTWSYSAKEVIAALEEARAAAEAIHGPLTKQPFLVTDNGSSFIARRFARSVRDDFAHVRIQYRTPTQLGLLERTGANEYRLTEAGRSLPARRTASCAARDEAARAVRVDVSENHVRDELRRPDFAPVHVHLDLFPEFGPRGHLGAQDIP